MDEISSPNEMMQSRLKLTGNSNMNYKKSNVK